jgi:hypothetical protein
MVSPAKGGKMGIVLPLEGKHVWSLPPGEGKLILGVRVFFLEIFLLRA